MTKRYLPIPPDKKQYESKTKCFDITPRNYTGSLKAYLEKNAPGVPLEEIMIEASRNHWDSEPVDRLFLTYTLFDPGNPNGLEKAQKEYEEELRKFCEETLSELGPKK